MHVVSNSGHPALQKKKTFGFQQSTVSKASRTVLTLKPQLRAAVSCVGSVLSRTSTSLENRDSIRPTGVVSKKCDGVRKIPVNRYRCKVAAAITPPTFGPRSLKIAKTAGTKQTFGQTIKRMINQKQTSAGALLCKDIQ